MERLIYTVVLCYCVSTVFIVQSSAALNADCTTADCGETEECDSNKKCVCKQGFDGSSGTCKDIDECNTNTDDCDTNAACSNTGGSFTCACNSGFAGNGKTCTDIDECTTNADDCDDTNAECGNTVGSFTCTCNSGFAGDGKTCKAFDCNNGDTCTNGGTCGEAPAKACSCVSGWAGDDCGRDIDECTTDTDDCDTNAACSNTGGSFTCACNSGFAGNGKTCTATVGVCTGSPLACPDTVDNGECSGNACVCKDGYQKEEQNCVPDNAAGKTAIAAVTMVMAVVTNIIMHIF